MNTVTEDLSNAQKLILVLKKITEPDFKGLDNTYLEKLLSYISADLDSDSSQDVDSSELSTWLNETSELWRSSEPNISVVNFVCQFAGILSRKEETFETLQRDNVLDNLHTVLQPVVRASNDTLKVAYMKFLNDIVSHGSGCEWVIARQHWKTVATFYLSNSNYYIEHEGLTFFRKLICNSSVMDSGLIEIFQELVAPIEMDESKIDLKDEKYCRKIIVSFKLLQGILKTSLHTVSNSVCVTDKLEAVMNVEKFAKFLLQNCTHEKTLDVTSSLLVLHSVLKYQARNELLSLEDIPSSILDVYSLLLEQNQINSVIKLSAFCQSLWSEIRNAFSTHSETPMHFIILQLIPVLVYRTTSDVTLFDSYVQRLFNLTGVETRKFGCTLREKVKYSIESRNWALKSLLSVTGNLNCLSRSEGLVLFQSLSYTLNSFVPEGNCRDVTEATGHADKKLKREVVTDDVTLLSSVLHALCLLIGKFQIDWTTSLENLCLLKMACRLLENADLPAVAVVQILFLVKSGIVNLSSPDCLNGADGENSSFHDLVRLLYKHMHNPNWEIRDSCIEVLTTVAESRYPSLRRLLSQSDFLGLLRHVLEGDSESYVRASALRALSAMTKMDIFRSALVSSDLPGKLVQILRDDCEGIVRREAVLLVREIYLGGADSDSVVSSSLYEAMAYSAVSDLHWEVKVNSLHFWEAVVRRVLWGSAEGQQKTSGDVTTRRRLQEGLDELSRNGCLHVLLSALNDDCDFQVVEKSVEIVTELAGLLRRYDIIDEADVTRDCNVFTIDSSPGLDRSPACPSPQDTVITKSDAVIEEIVNEMDINLLVTVRRTRDDGGEDRICERKSALRRVTPETFLLEIQNLDSKTFLDSKKRWFMNVDADLRSLLNDIVTVNALSETNVMDCY